jgi:hypothetical protein
MHFDEYSYWPELRTNPLHGELPLMMSLTDEKNLPGKENAEVT